MIEVWGEGNETSFGQSRAKRHGVIHPHHAWSTSTRHALHRVRAWPGSRGRVLIISRNV